MHFITVMEDKLLGCVAHVLNLHHQRAAMQAMSCGFCAWCREPALWFWAAMPQVRLSRSPRTRCCPMEPEESAVLHWRFHRAATLSQDQYSNLQLLKWVISKIFCK